MKRLVGALLPVIPGIVWANGFYIPVQDPAATAKGNAWVATADNPAAVYYNAAGLTQLDEATVRVGMYGVHLGMEADTAAGHFEADKAWQMIPQIYAAAPVTDSFVLGFGVNSPFGLSTDWPANSSFSTYATTTELAYGTAWLVGAWKLNECLSLGGGFGLSHADASLRQAVPIAPGGFIDFTGTDESPSWTASLRWEPAPEHAFGLVYRSRTDFELQGRSTLNPLVPFEAASLDFMTPATVAFGYAWRPAPEWSIEANIEWVQWEELGALVLAKGSGNVAVPFFWNSNFLYSAGVSRSFGDGWTFNTGYVFIENSQPDVTFNPGISDADRHWLSCGFEKKWDRFSVSTAYQYAFSDRTVSGSAPNAFGQSANGKYKSRFHGLMVSGEWRF